MNSVDYLQLLKLAAPETIVVVAALGVLFADLGVMRSESRQSRLLIAGAISALACFAAWMWIIFTPVHASVLNGVWVVDPLTQIIKQVILVLTLLTAAISINSTFTDHVGEYTALVLLATAGMMFMVSSEDILMIFVSLELTSLCLYALTAFNKRQPASAEAALKYFLYGSMAAAFTLFGLSLLYGLSGSSNLTTIARSLAGRGMDPMLAVALVMTVIGLGFKVAAVPFHLWAPDAYQGAPTPAAALIASGSKVASFYLFAKVMMVGFAGAEGSGAWGGFSPGWTPVIATLAVFSMVLGNLAAIAQRSVRRLLAYSAISHAGYMLLALLALAEPAHRQQAMAALVFYAATYGLTTVGAFAVVSVIAQGENRDDFGAFAGLSRRAPVLALCLMVFFLSLAGIPPLAGFFGKFYVFTVATGLGSSSFSLLWLVIFAIAMSAVSLYYYLQVLKQAYVVSAPDGTAALPLALSDRITLISVAIGVVILGVVPNVLLGPLQAAVEATLK